MQLHILLPILLIPVKALEVVMVRLRLPAVIAGILAGIILGPAVIGVIPSESNDANSYTMVHELAQIGLCVLLFRIGLETRLSDFLPIWRSATGVAIAGMVLPFVLGWALASLWGWSQQGAIFLGATLTATSMGVTASVMAEIGAQRSTEGHMILGAAVLDNISGLLVLTALVAFASPALSVTGQIMQAVIQGILFIAAGLFLGPYIAKFAIRLSAWSKNQGLLLVLAFSFFLLLAYAAKVIGLDMIIGAYAAGVAFANQDERENVDQNLKPLIELLTPLFFIMLGASMEFNELNPFSVTGLEIWGFTGLLLAVAVAGKLLSAVWIRRPDLNTWVIGAGITPRGEVGFVFAQIGLTSAVFSAEQFSVIVVVLIVTTIVGPVILRFAWEKDRPS